MKCVICADPVRLDFVSRRIAEGHTHRKVELLSKQSALVPNIKQETISKHAQHMNPDGTPITQVAVEVTKTQSRALQPDDDVAILVQRDIVQKLKDGEARVTVQHGLQAQQIIDRRVERAKDRELAVTLARLLHTPAPPPDLIEARPVMVIDGEYEDVSPEIG